MIDATKKFQVEQYLRNGGLFDHFMPTSQRFSFLEALNGEEAEFFIDNLWELAKTIRGIPVTYNTEDVETADKVLHLHYFGGGVDAWIVERDVGDTPDQNGEGPQLQAFGKITICGGGWEEAEWGYISIQELIENGIELDFYWEAKTVKEMERGG